MSISSMSINHALLTRAQLVKFLTARGFPISKSTLDKLTMPSRGEGPPSAGAWAGKTYYDPACAIRWARARFSKVDLAKRGRRTAA